MHKGGIMKKIICNYTITIFSLFLIAVVADAQMTTSQIAKKYSSSVVTIVALDENDQPLSLGSGFFINSDGDIATNYHVLQGSAKATIKTIKGDTGNIIEIIKADPKLDLLVAKTSLKKTEFIPLSDTATMSVGEDIVVIGNPAGLEGTVSKGIISGVRNLEGFKFIQITAPISPGSSGGPVFNMSGKVIGIATAYIDSGQNLNFAMPVNYLNSLKEGKINLASLPTKDLKIPKEGKEIIEATDIVKKWCEQYGYEYETICSVDYRLSNNSNHLIRDIRLLIVYFIEYEKILPEYDNLLKEFSDALDKGDKDLAAEINKKMIKRWRKMLSYSTDNIKHTILPKLSLQFSNYHVVKYCKEFDYLKNEKTSLACKVEIRILDYKIDQSSESSPVDFLSK